MSEEIWAAEAGRLVKWIADNMFEANRGVMRSEHLGVAVAFGNDGYETDPRSQREVNALRHALARLGIAELGFATDPYERYSWVLLFRPGDIPLEAFEGVIWGAWQDTPIAPESLSLCFAAYQISTACDCITKNEPRATISAN